MSNPKNSKKDDSIFNKALRQYLQLLQDRPVITKAISNSVVSGFGNILSQFIAPDPTTGGRINWRSVFAYSSFGFLINGPLMHHVYAFLEKFLPKDKPNAVLKRVLFDRLVFAPPFLFVFLYYISIMEGASSEAAVKKIKETFLLILTLNWTVWSFIQYINMNHVPLKLRTLFGNVCSLIWMIFISIKRRQTAH